MKEIPLGGKKAAGRVALVDDEDYGLVMGYRWHVKERRRADRNDGPYAVTTTPYKSSLGMHQLITGWLMTDHIDRDGLNNQRSNLRPATRTQNAQNSRPKTGSSSRFKGVAWHRGVEKWQVTIKADGRHRYLGCFADEEEAALAYNAAALEAWGPYAYLNEVAS